MDNIYDADVVVWQLISENNKGIPFYSILEMFPVIAYVNPLKDKQVLKHFTKLWNWIVNQTKYGSIREVTFATDHQN